jgi:hypothetical protein
MGAIIEGLEGHEGYAMWRLADGSVIPQWADGVREFSAYVAACECGWRSTGEHPPTEDGAEAAYQQWEQEHAVAELARQASGRREDLSRVLEWFGTQAGRLQDPAAVERVSRGLDRAQQLLAEVRRDLERVGQEREVGHER